MIGKIICWIRGFHESAYAVQDFEKEDNKTHTYGSIAPCWFCKAMPQSEEEVPNAYLNLVWKKQ